VLVVTALLLYNSFLKDPFTGSQ